MGQERSRIRAEKVRNAGTETDCSANRLGKAVINLLPAGPCGTLGLRFVLRSWPAILFLLKQNGVPDHWSL